ncbi:uncharacterized protein MONBRDRAFT_38408 [Monosiga brevicollis MX1]|uniref:Meckelin n=1 Tax=Monosiga brevicollis TaxID=81824 RepID=A9V7K2_MONBE|nr:uncharacterized protein MONBRDRAFT_38408 [Monosiga brevicollis MX1]EDQ86598.1 predicted protein [Monosiga brevicollis MX1]|eukprot:XP_001748711.1 hypothetical protein [Monosiga brevicollis MX1]
MFLRDAALGMDLDGQLRAVRWLQHLVLRFEADDNKDEGTFSSLYAVVTYGDVAMSSNTASVPARLEVEYVSDVGEHWQALQWSAVTFTLLSIVYAGYITTMWKRRHKREFVDGDTLLVTAGSALHAFSVLMAWACIGYSIHLVLVFTGRRQHSSFLPVKRQRDYLDEYFLPIVTWFLLADAIWLVYRQSSSDVFFIDWERSKLSPSVTAGDAKPPGRTENDPGQGSVPMISVWRRIQAAREWLAIQTYRRVPPAVRLLLVLLCLYGFDVGEYAENSSGYAPDYRSKDHHLLRFGLVVLIYVFLSLAIFAYGQTIYLRYVGDKLTHFVDRLSVLNVSLVVMDSDYRGWYIHGQSPHGFADVSMDKLLDNLRKDAELPRHTAADRQALTNARLHSTRAQADLNMHWMAYLQRSYPDLDYVVANRSFVDRLVDRTPVVLNRGIFYRDFSNGFQTTLFMGSERYGRINISNKTLLDDRFL